MPSRDHHIVFLIAMGLLASLTTCRQVYDPPAISRPNHYLVLDGFINMGPGSVTVVNLNRTRNLGDSSVTGIPELNAKVSITGTDGASYPLTDTAATGVYSSAPLSLDVTQQYSLHITTSDGQKYASDPVSGKITPPIDSIFWKQPGDLTIYVSAHDPANSTRYYRYDYSETWEHDSQLQTVWGVKNGMIFATDSTNQKDRCWSTAASTNILIASSSALGQDVIEGFALNIIPQSDPRVDIRYSILVRQYAMNEDAYNYWLLIQKTTQDVGTLFDLQPTQLIGNIHCTTTPSIPVIGYLTASSVQQQRIFILETYLTNWQHNYPGFGCDTTSIPVNPTNALIYNYPDSFFAPYYFITNGPLVLASKVCLDCTLTGGTTVQPSFW